MNYDPFLKGKLSNTGVAWYENGNVEGGKSVPPLRSCWQEAGMNHRHLWLSFLGPALWEVDIWAT